MQGDAMGLKVEVDRVLRKLEVSAAAAEKSVSLLRQIDTAKSRMEEACSLLKAHCLHPNLCTSSLHSANRITSLSLQLLGFLAGCHWHPPLQKAMQPSCTYKLLTPLASRKADRLSWFDRKQQSWQIFSRGWMECLPVAIIRGLHPCWPQ